MNGLAKILVAAAKRNGCQSNFSFTARLPVVNVRYERPEFVHHAIHQIDAKFQLIDIY